MTYEKQLLLGFLGLLIVVSNAEAQMTLYEYFSEGGISSGLVADDRNHFTLNGKDLTIFSGSLHYFRVHPDQWRDRLRKYRAAGLNAIEVYIPWNLHNPERGVFDFGDGDRDMSIFLDLRGFLIMAQEEDLFVIFRPGPYICAEWEFGGLPSWLLSEHPMYPRSSDRAYTAYAEDYLRQTFDQVRDLQFYSQDGSSGGPIILMQIENEYGSIRYSNWLPDKEHTAELKSIYDSQGMGDTLYFTSDSPAYSGDMGSVKGELMTANFKDNSIGEMDALLEIQPNRPILVSEYWTGWFDNMFNDGHNVMSTEKFEEILNNIFSYSGSVNFYMFHGGTNFGFTNGGTNFEGYSPYYKPIATSYDYDAPLSESGGYKDKYYSAMDMIAQQDPLASVITKPDLPAEILPITLPEVAMTEWIDFRGLIDKIPSSHIVQTDKPTSMERLSVNNNNGQSYGYINYRKEMSLVDGDRIKVRGHVRDTLQLMVDGVMINQPVLTYDDIESEIFGVWSASDAELVVDLSQTAGCDPTCTVDFFVENMGRVNYGNYHHFGYAMKKGIWEGDILLNDAALTDWQTYAMEFRNSWVKSLDNWEPYDADTANSNGYSPRLVRGTFTLDANQAGMDTFFDHEGTDWLHGAVFINGFNIGRYHTAGPAQVLYVPGPLLVEGENEVIVLDNFQSAATVKFTDTANYGTPVDT